MNNSRATHIHQVSPRFSHKNDLFCWVPSSFFLFINFFSCLPKLPHCVCDHCHGSLTCWSCCPGDEQQQRNPYPSDITTVQSPKWFIRLSSFKYLSLHKFLLMFAKVVSLCLWSLSWLSNLLVMLSWWWTTAEQPISIRYHHGSVTKMIYSAEFLQVSFSS